MYIHIHIYIYISIYIYGGALCTSHSSKHGGRPSPHEARQLQSNAATGATNDVSKCQCVYLGRANAPASDCHTLHLLENAFGSIQSFLVLGVDASDDVLILQLIVLYACYSATNSVRHGRCSNEGDDYDRHVFLLQFAKQGVMDHSRSRSALDRALNAPFWNTGRSTRRRQT